MRTLAALGLALLLPACASTYNRDWVAMDPAVPTPASFEDKGAGGGAAPDSKDGKPTSLKKYYGPHGGYVGAGLLWGFEQFDVGGPESATNSSAGFSLRGGWRIPEGYAAELVIEDANDFKIRAGGGFETNLDLLSVGVQGKYYFTKDQTQPYFMAGFGIATARIEHSSDDTGTYFRIGGGVQHYLKEDMALYFEIKFDQLMGEVNDLDHFDLEFGFLIHF